MQIQNFIFNENNAGISSETLLLLGLLSKSKESFSIQIIAGNQTKQIVYALKNFINFYNIKNLHINESNYPATKNVKTDSKFDLYFSYDINEKLISKNNHLIEFILSFEKLFGELPYYSEKNKYFEKFEFINNQILLLTDEFISH